MLAVPLLIGLFVVVGTQPLPYVTYLPGPTVDILAARDGKEIVEVSGHKAYYDDGELRMTTSTSTSRRTTSASPSCCGLLRPRPRRSSPTPSVYAPDETDESSDARVRGRRWCPRRTRRSRPR